MPKTGRATKRRRTNDRWAINEARANLSTLVRRAAEEPQRITVRGKDAAVIVSAVEFERMRSSTTGMAVVEAFARCPHDLEIERVSVPIAVREIEL